MNKLMNPSTGQPVTMSSREIAELTGKRHDNVMRDIREMLVELHGEGGVLSFEDTQVNQQNGQSYPIFMLPKRECLVLVAGYSTTMRARIIDRWLELEAGHAPALPDLSNPAMLRNLLLGYTEKVLALEATIEAQAPKVRFADAVGAAEDLQKIHEVAKALNQGPRKFRQWLIDTGVLMVNGLPFQVHVDSKRFRVIEVPFKDADGRDRIRLETRVTGRGVTFLQQRLAKACATQGA